MIRVEYTRLYNSVAISDFEVENEYRNFVRNYDWYRACWRPTDDYQDTYYYATSNIITRIRVGIAEGELDASKIMFHYNGLDFQANEYGAIPNWPEGFCDTEFKLCERLVRAATAKRKAKRAN